MEDLFKVMGDALNPNKEPEKLSKRAEAFHELVKIVENVKDNDDRLKLYLALRNYIACD
jgi:hypothetical protein